MKAESIHEVVKTLRREVKKWSPPAIERVCRGERDDPFLILLSCLLSLRTKDEVTVPASERLFELAGTPRELLAVPEQTIAKAIYPVGFYKTKARLLHHVSRELLERYEGRVPDSVEELTTIKGVGRKTANLVVTVGYRKPGICVDTHVHRISNRLGYIRTKTADDTETALRKKLPHEYWIEFNELLVTFGQNLCVPVSPWCSRCPIVECCDRRGVERSR